jgi:hypothetical protein
MAAVVQKENTDFISISLPLSVISVKMCFLYDNMKCVLITALCLKPKIPNGKLSVETNHYVNPETITIQCNPGYRMVGSQNISCSENKSWSPAVPKCEMVNNTMTFMSYDKLKQIQVRYFIEQERYSLSS